jgi:hypothetical protein
MAKVNGPFMSLSASGTFADTLTASIWKGRPYMRQRVIPANPQTALQLAVRRVMGALAKAAHAVLTSYADEEGIGSPFFTTARDAAPSGQSWISYLQKAEYARYDTAIAAFGNLSGTIKGYFEVSAALASLIDYTPPIPDAVEITAGAQLYLLADFASVFLTGDVKDAADTAIVGASQQDVTDFEAIVHETT